MIFTEADHDLARDLFERIRIETAVEGGGVTRPSYGEKETRAMQLVAEAADKLQLFTAMDDCANLVMTIEPQRPKRALWVGSHLDSVPCGGNYDGLAGVVAALLILNKAKAKNEGLGRPLVGMGLRGEESTWFGTPHIGAKALLGKLLATDLQRYRGVNTLMLGHAMQDCGVKAEALETMEKGLPLVSKDEIAAWWELHIEQGPVLEGMNVPVGLVTHVRGSVRAPNARILGAAGHSGTTPHEMREDAVARFADLMVALEQRRSGLSELGKDLVFTCGIVGTNPRKHGITSIADEVSFTLDVRSTDYTTMKDFYQFAALYGDPWLELGDLTTTQPCAFDAQTYMASQDACRRLRIPCIALPSGAGHDATVFQSAGIRAGMLFVRNQNGSHNPNEAMNIDDFMLGVEALYNIIACT